MSRRKFIESHGATCRNWRWSWSFINEMEEFIIFGTWEGQTDGIGSRILSKEWKINRKGKKAAAYNQSREHIRLVEEERYKLYTFPMQYSAQNEGKDGRGPASIGGFDSIVTEKLLRRRGKDWYADDLLDFQLPEEIVAPEQYIEGASKTITVNAYERNAAARAKCVAHRGYKCAICEFDFEKVYGSIGKDYIHVHHVVPLSEIREEYKVDPVKDLIPICPNCHAMIHRKQPPHKIAELRRLLRRATRNSDNSVRK